MKLIFLGSGAALTVDEHNFQSNMLWVNNSGERLLLDCGSDIRRSLFKQNLTHLDIQNVYISHLHADHVGGLEWLALSSRFDSTPPKKPNLFIAQALKDDLWNKTLSGGLSTIPSELVTLETYFTVHVIPPNGSFIWSHQDFKIVQTVHAMNGFALLPSFGLFSEVDGQKVFITTDTQFCPNQMIFLYEESDVVFHDCETSSIKSGVHAHYEQLNSLPKELKAKMWLYHYNTKILPDARKDGFRGFVSCGQCFDFTIPETLFS